MTKMTKDFERCAKAIYYYIINTICNIRRGTTFQCSDAEL